MTTLTDKVKDSIEHDNRGRDGGSEDAMPVGQFGVSGTRVNPGGMASTTVKRMIFNVPMVAFLVRNRDGSRRGNLRPVAAVAIVPVLVLVASVAALD